MSVRILHDDEQGLANLYQSETDVAFGPVFYADQAAGARGYTALQLAEKFIEWARLRDSKTWLFKTDQELIDKYSAFQALDWRQCDECCGERLHPSAQEACDECLHECQECGDKGVETVKVSGPVNGRFCGECVRTKVGNYPGFPPGHAK